MSNKDHDVWCTNDSSQSMVYWLYNTRSSITWTETIWAKSLIIPHCFGTSAPTFRSENRDIWAWPALADFQHLLVKGSLLKHRQPNISLGNLCTQKKGHYTEGVKIDTGLKERKKHCGEFVQCDRNAQTKIMKSLCGVQRSGYGPQRGPWV